MDIKRVSYKKIQIKKTINITCDGFTIGETELTTTYKELKGLSKYLRSNLPDKFINRLSQLYGIRKKFISMSYVSNSIIVDDIEFEVMIPDNIVFKDIDWYKRYNRELKIRQILYN